MHNEGDTDERAAVPLVDLRATTRDAGPSALADFTREVAPECVLLHMRRDSFEGQCRDARGGLVVRIDVTATLRERVDVNHPFAGRHVGRKHPPALVDTWILHDLLHPPRLTELVTRRY